MTSNGNGNDNVRAPIAPKTSTLAYDGDEYLGTNTDDDFGDLDSSEVNPTEPQSDILTSDTSVSAAATPAAVKDAPLFYAAVIRDRLFGAVLGAALGDALGLPVEGDEPVLIAERFGQYAATLGLPYKGVFRGYASGDWTDATDTTVLTMRTLAAYFSEQTDTVELDLASRLVKWQKGGFLELGDTAGLTPESVVIRAMAQPGFLEDPVSAAAAVKGPKAENGALIRTLPCAFTAAPEAWADALCAVTHADERCAATSMTFALLVHALAARPSDVIPPEVIVAPVAAGRDRIAEEADKGGATEGAKVTRRQDFMRRLTESLRVEQLGLEDREHRSYTIKTLACAMWAFRQVRRAKKLTPEFFMATMRRLASRGGDASANCAVAGAVLGVVLGEKNLPAEWLAALPNLKWLRSETEKFMEAARPTWALTS